MQLARIRAAVAQVAAAFDTLDNCHMSQTASPAGTKAEMDQLAGELAGCARQLAAFAESFQVWSQYFAHMDAYQYLP